MLKLWYNNSIIVFRSLYRIFKSVLIFLQLELMVLGDNLYKNYCLNVPEFRHVKVSTTCTSEPL